MTTHPDIDMTIKPTLHGDRVVLRPVTVDDVPGLLDLLADTASNRLTGTHAGSDVDAATRWYATRADQDDRLDLAVVERASGEYAGEVVLNDLDRDNRSCNFRIGLRPGFHDRGLGSEATGLIVAYAFETLGLHRISLEVYAFNPRARRVYEKVGFVAEGTRRDALLWDGEWVDAIAMSILSTDPRSGSPSRSPG
jgi:RimJ/RimL family protein N-acetyltransferase